MGGKRTDDDEGCGELSSSTLCMDGRTNKIATARELRKIECEALREPVAQYWRRGGDQTNNLLQIFCYVFLLPFCVVAWTVATVRSLAVGNHRIVARSFVCL